MAGGHWCLMMKVSQQKLEVPFGTRGSGIACTSQHIYISDQSWTAGSVAMFDYEGQHIKCIPIGRVACKGIAISVEQMYVTSGDDHKVYTLKLPDGDGKTTFLQESDGISNPHGVAASSTRVAVTSHGNHTVHVFNDVGELQFKYGEHGNSGSGIGQFQWPCGVALDCIGRVIIVDRGNNQIQILSSKGEHLGNIKLDGLNSPQGLCINNDGNIVVGCDCRPWTIAVYKYSVMYMS